jgi:serine/threonine protein kinase
MSKLPSGTVTFLFTDVEGSTRLLQHLGKGYVSVLAEHHRILRRAVAELGGREVDSQGESFFFAFERANAAIDAAILAQRALIEHPWPDGGEVRVRMGVHTGEPIVDEERYVGLVVHRAARIGAVGHGGQVLLSNATRELLEDGLAGVSMRDLGSYRLKDFDRDERLYQLDVAGLRSDFPPLNAKRMAEPHAASQADVQIGAEFLGYRIEELIGQGGMGVVYRAYDLRLKRTVALKLVTPELALDDRFRERFTRETELAMALEHPNVVPVHDAGDVAGRLYLAMRLVTGTDLRKLLRAEAPLEASRALSICRQVANALDAAHARGLVHRDVKPSNVLLDEDEHVYLADFGLTRRREEQGAQPGDGRSVGTPAYLAPEQIEGKPLDGRADVYGLGCLLFESLTGTVPYARDSRLAVAWAHLEEEPPRASELNPALPEPVDDVVRAALAKEPEERYRTCGALIEAAEEAFGIRSRWRSRRLLLATGLVAAAAVTAAAAALLVGGGTEPPTVVPNSLVKIDATTRKVVDVVPVGRIPDEITVAGRYVFAASQGDGTLTRVDRRTGSVVTSGRYDASDGLAWEGHNRLWVGSVGRRVVQLVDATLPPYDLGASLPYVPLPRGTHGMSLAVGADSLWIATSPAGCAAAICPGALSYPPVVERWGLHPLRRLTRYSLHPDDYGLDVAYGYGAAWVALGDPADALLRINARTGRARRIHVGAFPVGVATGFGSVWVTQWYNHAVRRIDPTTGRTLATIPTGRKPTDLAVTRDSVWVSNHCSGNVARIDPRTNSVAETIETGLHPQWLAADDEFVWAGVAGRPYFEPCSVP